MAAYPELPVPRLAIDDQAIIARDIERMAGQPVEPAPAPRDELPDFIDLSHYLHFIRKQENAGCWGYSWLAIWDIMAEMDQPYTPNLSMSMWMWIATNTRIVQHDGGFFGPDGRWYPDDDPSRDWLVKLGISTEGTDMTSPTQWCQEFTRQGLLEAPNYQLMEQPSPIEVSSQSFMRWLASGHPIRACIPGHFVAIVGYDRRPSKRTFKYLNSCGDRWGDGGYSTYTFDQIDAKNPVSGGEIIRPRRSKPVPSARIRFTTPQAGGRRSNINMWISAEGSPRLKRKIWPAWEWPEDDCKDLHYTVRLPEEFIWPPAVGNRIILDIYNSAAYSEAGATMREFTAAFGAHVIKCDRLQEGSVTVGTYQHKRLTIP